MRYRSLGNTDLKVSIICLGTMTYGEQNTEKEAHEQINFALEKGVNFLDTAEMYAVPSNKNSQGKTEECIGSWISKNHHKRQDIIIATKVTGPSPGLQYISDIPLGFSKARILEAVDKSLERLHTDYIDLYQLHWPERKSNMFGQRDYKHYGGWENNFEKIIDTLEELKKSGKIRHYGLSNETSWGVMKNQAYAESKQAHGYISIQNAYNLLNRTFEINLAEVSIREGIPLLAYSPLGMGMLSGKYHQQDLNFENRLLKYKARFPRYHGKHVFETAGKYVKLAREIGISPTQMALAFVNDRPFICSNIIGATTINQLKENIESVDVKLDKSVLEQIDIIHNTNPNPAP